MGVKWYRKQCYKNNIYVKHTYKSLHYFSSAECLSIDEAIEMYTIGGAWAAMRENYLGQLVPGYQADFVMLDSPHDICTHPADLLQTHIHEVWVAGQQKL